MEPSQAGGELAAELLRGATKGLFNLGRKGASEAVKSDLAKKTIKVLQTNIWIKLWIVLHQIYPKN